MKTGLTLSQKRRWTLLGRRVVIATMVYNMIEASVALVVGTQSCSIALRGFGINSLIEIIAALLLIGRLGLEGRGADPKIIAQKDRQASRFVGASFLLLALYVCSQAAYVILSGQAPQISHIGIVLASLSLILMPGIAMVKLRVARELSSEALRAEAKETLACSYLSLTLLAGLAANAWAGWWWADPMAALLMLPWLIIEGFKTLRESS